jgi:hypothetical protein
MFATGIENSIPTIHNGRTRVDQMDVCGHYKHWRTDFDCVEELGIHFLRYGPPLHRSFLAPGKYDWEFADLSIEEAVTRAEERFEEFAVDEDGLTEEQLAEALPGLETEDITELFQEIDEDGDGVISREEWRQWADRAFAEVAGPEGLTPEQYGAWERTGRVDMDPMIEEPGVEEPEEPAQQ